MVVDLDFGDSVHLLLLMDYGDGDGDGRREKKDGRNVIN